MKDYKDDKTIKEILRKGVESPSAGFTKDLMSMIEGEVAAEQRRERVKRRLAILCTPWAAIVTIGIIYLLGTAMLVGSGVIENDALSVGKSLESLYNVISLIIGKVADLGFVFPGMLGCGFLFLMDRALKRRMA